VPLHLPSWFLGFANRPRNTGEKRKWVLPARFRGCLAPPNIPRFFPQSLIPLFIWSKSTNNTVGCWLESFLSLKSPKFPFLRAKWCSILRPPNKLPPHPAVLKVIFLIQLFLYRFIFIIQYKNYTQHHSPLQGGPLTYEIFFCFPCPIKYIPLFESTRSNQVTTKRPKVPPFIAKKGPMESWPPTKSHGYPPGVLPFKELGLTIRPCGLEEGIGHKLVTAVCVCR